MRSLAAILLLSVCLLLSGCGSDAGETRFNAFSDALARRDTLSFEAALRCEYADRTLSFLLGYTLDEDGESVTVLQPERIAGIRARLSDGGTLEYDGLILDPGPLDPYGLSPMNALPKLVAALREGHLDTSWTEEDAFVCHLILDDHLSATVWFASGSMTPLRCELQSDEAVHIFCDITHWS